MKYAFDTEYLKNNKYRYDGILIPVTKFFFSNFDYCEFEGETDDKQTLSRYGSISRKEKDEIIELISKGVDIKKLVINDLLIQDTGYKFILRQSMHDWVIDLNQKEYEELLAWLEHSKLPQDIFFPVSQFTKREYKNPLLSFLKKLGIHIELSKLYSPRERNKRR